MNTFTMQIPFTIHPGAREVEGAKVWFTSTVLDMNGRAVPNSKGRSLKSQLNADQKAERKARAWGADVREFAYAKAKP